MTFNAVTPSCNTSNPDVLYDGASCGWLSYDNVDTISSPPQLEDIIRGTVISEDGQPFNRAQVEVHDSADGSVVLATPDNSGR